MGSEQPDDLGSGWGLSAEHLQGIGEVAVRWAGLEFTLSSTIWLLTGLSGNSAWAVTSHLSERTRADICLALAREVLSDTQLVDDLRVHLRYVTETLYPKRNKIIHSRWGTPSNSTATDTSVLQSVRARGRGVDIESVPFTSQQIMAIAQEIYDAGELLGAIKYRIDLVINGPR